MNNQVALESLASDLRRVALGLQRGSTTMANRFAQEALRRRNEVEISSVDEYIKKLLRQLDKAMEDPEDALMYSSILQNYALHRYQSASS